MHRCEIVENTAGTTAIATIDIVVTAVGAACTAAS